MMFELELVREKYREIDGSVSLLFAIILRSRENSPERSEIVLSNKANPPNSACDSSLPRHATVTLKIVVPQTPATQKSPQESPVTPSRFDG